MSGQTVRRPLLVHTLLDVLAEAGHPLRAGQTIDRVRDRITLNEAERSLNNSGRQRFATELQYASMWLQNASWLLKEAGTWDITDEGRQALASSSGPDELLSLLTRKRVRGPAHRARIALVDHVLAELPSGRWVSMNDLAKMIDLDPSAITGRLLAVQPRNWHRVLDADGVLHPSLSALEHAQRELLEDDGIHTGLLGVAEPDTRVADEELNWIVESVVNSGERQARAWLVRGSSVKGVNLVPGWLDDGICSLSASRLGPLSAGASLDDVKAAVDRDYDYLSYSAKNDHAVEFHVFLSRMAPGDLIVTNAEDEIHLGVITGDPEQVDSDKGLSNLRRAVDWRTIDHPIDYADLPASVAARLGNQNTVTDLTAELGVLEGLLPEALDEEDLVKPEPVRELEIRDADDKLAEALLLSRDFLQETIELLKDRKQIILYGPPGTGKTYLAQHLAWHLTDRSMVRLVQFHPAYSYEDFFEGFRPVASADGNGVGFRLTPGPLRRLVDAARENPERPHILIVDEINRANLAKVFGELYFLLEYRNHNISLTYSEDGKTDFSLPENLFLIGTMNTADRSIALVDAAMRRRFAFLELHPTTSPVEGMLHRWLAKRELDTRPARLLDALNARIEDRDFRIGPSYLMRPEVHRPGGLDRVWRTSILPLLVEHHYGEGVDVDEVYGLESLNASLTDHPEP
jgi:5-methylcytosine-specific restriction protein B